jgi:hypothetical protein
LQNIRASANLAASDAFTKRESASEELFIRQEEKAKYVHSSPPATRGMIYTSEEIREDLMGHGSDAYTGSLQSRRSSASSDNIWKISTSTCQYPPATVPTSMADNPHSDDVIKESEASGQGESK